MSENDTTDTEIGNAQRCDDGHFWLPHTHRKLAKVNEVRRVYCANCLEVRDLE